MDLSALVEHGFMLLTSHRWHDDGWRVLAELGMSPRMLETQPIRPHPSARSFAGSQVFTPLHTDSQDFLGAPPGLQVMHCRRPAADGGETLLLDTWAWIEALPSPVQHALFTQHRTQPFYFGAVRGPTVARKGEACVFTHSPVPPGDALGRLLADDLARRPPLRLRLNAGDTLLVDNHRMLHGRTAFTDPKRDFVRLLAWLSPPSLSLPRPWMAGCQTLAYAPPPMPNPDEEQAVARMLRGVPPARLAAELGVGEEALYRWRSGLFAARRPGG